MPSGYEYTNHIVAVRMRLQGAGAFISTLDALENDPSQDLADATMSTTANRPVNLLANINAPRVQFHGRIQEIDEHFTLKNLVFYVKPIASGYPQ